jgi:FixJ family two-component response regulator
LGARSVAPKGKFHCPFGKLHSYKKREIIGRRTIRSAGSLDRAARRLPMVATLGSAIILVEDDDSMREAFKRLLQFAGFECVAYTSAEALLSAPTGQGAACVVSDLKLPRMSGLELLFELRARGGWPPLILITAHDAPALREEALRCGAADYLAKPFRGTALLDAIKVVVDRARLS